MVNDLIGETRGRIANMAVSRRCAPRAAPGRLFRRDAAEERSLKTFLHARMYDAPPVKAIKDEAQRVLTGLFAAYRDDPRRLPPEWRPGSEEPVPVLRAIGDFVAGMTDRYAIKRYQELVGPVDLPEGF
jgi:dGTPase